MTTTPIHTAANLSPALERVMREVLAMKKAGDIGNLVEGVWGVLRELEFEFVSCALMLMDEERGWMTSYNIWDERFVEPFGSQHHAQRLGSGLCLFLSQTSLSATPSRYESAVAAWRKRTVEHHVLSQAEIQELVRLNRERYGGDLTPENYPIRFYLHVPFSSGVFTLRTASPAPDQFAGEQVEFLKRLVEIFSAGYARYREFLQVARDRAVQKVRAEVQAMQQARSITGVLGLLWEELHRAGIGFDYMSISVRDQEEDFVHLYSVWHQYRDRLSEIPLPLLRADIAEGADLYYTQVPHQVWQENHTETTGIWSVKQDGLEEYASRIKRLWQVERWPVELRAASAMAAPFSQGRLLLGQFHLSEELAFTPENLEVLEAFAEALGLGFARFFDFQRLERQNRHLEVQRAVDRLRAEVGAMRKSGDIVEVVTLLGQQLRELGMEFSTCSIGLIDEEAGLVRLYGVGLMEIFRLLPQDRIRVADRSIIDRLAEESQGPIFIREIAAGLDFAYTVEPLEGSPALEERGRPPRIVRRSEEDARQVLGRYRQRWTPSWTLEQIPRTVIRVPFSYGSIALTHAEVGQYTQKDVDLVAAFAEALSLGFSRFLDFQRLEQRNRELEVERSVQQVQSAVQSMKNSADLVPVILLISKELCSLGLEYDFCSVSLVDRKADRVRFYGTIGSQVFLSLWREIIQSIEQPFGPDAMERLEHEEGPIFISGVPGYEGQVVHYVSAPLDSYYGRIQHIAKTTAVLRTEEETLKVMPEYLKYWKVEHLPTEWLPRAILRSPFAGGTIALNRMQPQAEAFSPPDARILERFAEAFALGYARHLDFRRLEEQNKALEAASRVKSEFLANMSHELRTPMNSIINFSSLILEGVYGDISDELRDAVEEIDRNSENLLALINDILDISKIEAGAMQLQLAVCAPEGFVETAIATMERKATETGLELISEVQGELPLVRADERRITLHVLINLVKNAIKFTREGQVRVGARKEGDEVLFWVADTGIGIPEEERERIFETFHQVDSSITREAEGTGLGLAIARKFVELHGGRIWVESELGEGSTFWFILPVGS